MTLKIAVVAPMPSARVSTATAVKPGFFRNWRKANLRSFINQNPKSEGRNPKEARSPKFELPLAARRRWSEVGIRNVEFHSVFRFRFSDFHLISVHSRRALVVRCQLSMLLFIPHSGLRI